MGAMNHDETGGAATLELARLAERALTAMRAAGFEQAQAAASLTTLTELNLEMNRASLLRSGETLRVGLVGIVDARRASTELSDPSDEAVADAVRRLHADALGAPQDDAHAVSAGQRAEIMHGPLTCPTARLADSVAELLAFREHQTPSTVLKEGAALHERRRSVLLTGGGSDLRCDIGRCELSAVFNAREGARSSSFNYQGGSTHELGALPAHQHFGIGELMQEVARSIDAKPLSSFAAPFEGDVVLTPAAAASLLQWLLGQLCDDRLLSGTSMFRERVGQVIASPLLTLASRFDAPGVAAVSSDGFATPPVTLLDAGQLTTLTPSLYASRKTGLPHVPLAAGGGWMVPAGDASRHDIVAAVPRGALVARLSMGMPAANGDFAGVVKNSFLIERGEVGAPLAETMISGNVARMLRDIKALSAERIDTGEWCLPWMRVAGLRFS